MNRVCRKLSFSIVLFSLVTIVWMNGDDNGLPEYIQGSLCSRGRLSKSVESIEGSSDFIGKQQEESMLEDLPFHIEPASPEETFHKKNPGIAIKVAKQPVMEVVQQEKTETSAKNLPKTKLSGTSEKKKTVKQQKTAAVDVKQKIPTSPLSIEVLQQEEIEELSPEKKRLFEQEEERNEEIVFNFENADLSNLVSYIETLFNVKFISDDSIKPMAKDAKAVTGNKISFKTQKPMNKPEAWSLFLTFMDMAGFSVVQESNPRVYRIMPINAAKKAALQSFIGIDSELLPDNDTRIRYVYFVKDIPLETLKNIIASLKSSAADALILQELKAFIITDSSYNIKSLMKIVKELDKVSMPQAMSVLKLHRVDAAHVKKLYDSLIKETQPQQRGRLFGPRRPATTLYFPENTSIIVESRTNSLILLGTREGIKKIEDFVVKNIDIDSGTPYSPLHVYSLKYADAITVADIMNGVTKFGQNAAASKVGGVRGEDKYIKQMTFTPEQTGNRLVIRGDYEDYLKAKEIIESLDNPQPQVAIEILILSIGITDIRELGSQIRNSPRDLTTGALHNDGLFRKNITAQTSGIRLGGEPKTVVQNLQESGAKRLLGDLISLVTGSVAGNTIISLGSDYYGVWGIFNALKTVSNLQVISNPFLIATNKTKATVSLGEIRNVKTATIEGQQSVETFSDKEANLTVEITPQINSDGMIVLQLKISIVEFRDDTVSARETSARTIKVIETSTIVADKEVLALGGLIKNKIEDALSKTPILGNIPILGWLFKSKKKSAIKEDLLVLLSARIIDPRVEQDVDAFTEGHIDDYKSTVKQMETVHLKRDPIDRAFFADKKDTVARKVDELIFKRGKKKEKKKKIKRRKLTEKKKNKKRQEKTIFASIEKPRIERVKKKKRGRRNKNNFRVTATVSPVVESKTQVVAGHQGKKLVEGNQHD